MKIKVLVFPENRRVNPYQTLLYKNFISTNKVDIKFFDTSFFGQKLIPLGVFNFLIPLRLIKYRFEGYNIFHLHWFGPLHLPTENAILRIISTIYLLIFLFLLKYLLNYKMVWTIHEILPPRKEFLNDLLVRRFISYISDANIVQSESIQAQLNIIKFDMSKTFLIPHGNYKEYYKNIISESQARKYLKIDMHKFVFLFIGIIAEYKGLEELLKSFLKIKQYNNIMLLVAGENHYRNLNSIVYKYKAKLQDKLKFHIGFIPENRLQYYFNACNAVVLPFINTTNSGSTLLALSFYKPVIAPRMGSLRDLPEDVGYFYNANEHNGLVNSLNKALEANKTEIDRKREHIINYISKMESWKEISDSTFCVYKHILNI